MVVEVGETEMLAPVPTNEFPHEPLYHFQEAPVPNVPPETLNVTDVPAVMLVDDALADTGATLFELMVKFKLSVRQPLTDVYVPVCVYVCPFTDQI